MTIDRLEVHLARFKGSFFAVRFAVEDLAAVDMPDPLLIYLPGAERDPKDIRAHGARKIRDDL